MASYSAKDVAALRRMTGAGMLDSKNALEEMGGDMEEAAKLLRMKGLAGAAKRSDREASEGAVAVARSGDAAAVVELRCETDFVAKAEEFVALAEELAALVAAKGEDATDEVAEEVDRLRATLKENISVGQVRRLVAEPGQVLDTYVHRQAGRGVNAVAVVLEGGSEELAHDIAVHIAFAKPTYLSRDEVPAADAAAERATLEEISRNEGKPEAALGKIVEGRMNGWYKERVLLDQAYVRDEKQTIAGMLGSARIVSFAQVVLRRLSARIVGEPRRIVLKMSGEALASAASDETIDAATVERMAKEMARAMEGGGLELAVVVGGGNIWRGTTGESGGMDRATSDTMGMLGTVINSLALQDALEQQDQPTRVLSALSMAEVAEPYIRRRAIRHLEKGRIVIFAAGMGNPFFTTDTPAALRAAEIGAELLCKGTHSGVDGVYSADPKLDPTATRYDEISFMEVINRDLRVMDLTAITFCKDNNLPIRVFDLMIPGNIPRALSGEQIGTLVR